MNGAFRWDPTVARSMATLMHNQNPQSAQSDWGFASAVGGHAFGTVPDLPNGYGRTMFNEERELASKGYTEGFGTAALSFGASVAGTYAVWGSPIKDLTSKIPAVSGIGAFTSGRYAAALDLGGNLASAVASPFGHAGGWLGGKAAEFSLNATHWGAGRAANFLSLGGSDYMAGKAATWGSSLLNSGRAGAAAAEAAAAAAGPNAGFLASSANSIRSAYNTAKVGLGTILSQSTFKAGTAAIAGQTARAGAWAVGGVASIALNPVALAQIYATDKAIGYAGNIMTNFETQHSAEKEMVAKSDRILQFGAADISRGLSGGLTSAQRGRMIDTMKTMSVSSAMSSDLMGMGKDSIFGGQSAYTERFKELKSMLSVGTDMGMFDASKSFEDFEKKFIETVKVVDKMSKMIRKTKGEVLALVGSMQNEGVFNPQQAGRAIEQRDSAARATGVDLGTTMMEANMGSQMGIQAGFSSLFGSSRMTDNRLIVGRAKRTGALSKEDIFRLGGEQNIIAEMTQVDMNIMNDKNMVAEMARMVSRDSVTGEIKIDKNVITRGIEASKSHAASQLEGRVRVNMREGISYSELAGVKIAGGALLDKTQVVKDALAKGLITSDMMNEMRIYTQQQEMSANRPGASAVSKKEALRMNYIRNGISNDVADIMARQYTGEFTGAAMDETLAVRRDRIKEEREENKASATGYYASRIVGGALTAVTHAVGAAVAVGSLNRANGDDFVKWATGGRSAKQISENIYVASAATAGKESEAREAFRYKDFGESDDSILSSTTYQQRLDILKYGPAADIRNTKEGRLFASLEGITSEYLKGEATGMMLNKNEKLRTKMLKANRSATGYDSKGRRMEDTIASYLNVSGEGTDAMARDLLLGEGPVVLDSNNAERVAAMLETAKIVALTKEGVTPKQRESILEDYKSYSERIKIGSEQGPSLNEFKMISDRKHKLFSATSDDAKSYFRGGASAKGASRSDFIAALGGADAFSNLILEKGADVEKASKGFINALQSRDILSDKDIAFMSGVASKEGARFMAGKGDVLNIGTETLSKEEVLKRMQDIGGKNEGAALILDRLKMLADPEKRRSIAESGSLGAIRNMLNKANIFRNWDASNALRSEISKTIGDRITIAKQTGSIDEGGEAIGKSMQEFVGGSGDNTDKLYSTIAKTSKDVKGLSHLGLSEDRMALMRRLSGGSITFKELQDTGMKLESVNSMMETLKASKATDEQISKMTIDLSSKEGKLIKKEIATQTLSEVSANQVQGKSVEDTAAGALGTSGNVTNESIAALKDATMVLRQCLVALRLI